eukprot:CAMPEP_0173152030 /NCGR_PEP_ID=MMETSP1105-20130129/11966_1 /TAXON_ID=2985 /ORGANISM="Ochromonas sp., Strain BG-1" /LENGTH=102 /DNA_ID=CAMNT_0014067585 /DNA_START=44 /DNA_END=348 /DNA_ORIENTATION=+
MANFFLLLSLIVGLFGTTFADYGNLRKVGAPGNSTLKFCDYEATCNVGGIEGVCVSISAGCCSGAVTSGLCPGSSDIKCCTSNSCSTPQGSGTCVQTSACSG